MYCSSSHRMGVPPWRSPPGPARGRRPLVHVEIFATYAPHSSLRSAQTWDLMSPVQPRRRGVGAGGATDRGGRAPTRRTTPGRSQTRVVRPTARRPGKRSSCRGSARRMRPLGELADLRRAFPGRPGATPDAFAERGGLREGGLLARLEAAMKAHPVFMAVAAVQLRFAVSAPVCRIHRLAL